ncbi:hypothetical protein FHS82_002197 [Pseudochelatococcus lubricantis]|uniref:DUF2764 family protein n=1 Tax=Pseudochelatococcus lubricantis TaxID=1538102 RepID=A0ABX0V212_9HYPH|nr:DUF2764 family protein [Pseudochelatococcus lubricantis]NIJ58355.1 hypothetical protein [Pseudochelatococcus lubricantis]
MNGSRADPYVMLVASLPDLGGFLEAQSPPINWLQIEERLAILTPQDRAQLEAMAGIIAWERIQAEDEDATVLARAEQVVASLESEVLRDLVRDRLEIRTVIAALRRRHAGEDAPAAHVRWGYGRFVNTIRANWSDPAFGIARAFPWVGLAREKLESGDTAGLERVILQAVWTAAGRYADAHSFDIEAVAIYLLRWAIVNNWAQYDTAAATSRFTRLLDEALDDALPNREAVT